MTRTSSPETIQTTERSLDIVREIQRRDGARIADIAAEFEMAKSTAYKHLVTLERRGYLVKEGDHYHIGVKFTNLGEYARTRKPEYRLASEKVQELADRTDEEVDFVVENDGRGMTIYLYYDISNPYSDKSVDATNKHWRPGTYYYLHCTAAGKAILSGLSDERVDAIIDKWGLPARTDQTITDREALFEELDAIREHGFAYSHGEYTDGLGSVAKAVSNTTPEPLGSFAINTPLYRLQVDTVREELRGLLTEVIETFESEIRTGLPS